MQYDKSLTPCFPWSSRSISELPRGPHHSTCQKLFKLYMPRLNVPSSLETSFSTVFIICHQAPRLDTLNLSSSPVSQSQVLSIPLNKCLWIQLLLLFQGDLSKMQIRLYHPPWKAPRISPDIEHHIHSFKQGIASGACTSGLHLLPKAAFPEPHCVTLSGATLDVWPRLQGTCSKFLHIFAPLGITTGNILL